jgi:hypothetical protein
MHHSLLMFLLQKNILLQAEGVDLSARLQHIAHSLGLSDERRELLTELLQTIVAAGSDGAVVAEQAQDASQLQALGLVRQLQFSGRWVAIGTALTNCAGMVMPWVDPDGVLHIHFTNMTRVRLV